MYRRSLRTLCLGTRCLKTTPRIPSSAVLDPDNRALSRAVESAEGLEVTGTPIIPLVLGGICCALRGGRIGTKTGEVRWNFYDKVLFMSCSCTCRIAHQNKFCFPTAQPSLSARQLASSRALPALSKHSALTSQLSNWLELGSMVEGQQPNIPLFTRGMAKQADCGPHVTGRSCGS